jgi:hypothetical protein
MTQQRRKFFSLGRLSELLQVIISVSLIMGTVYAGVLEPRLRDKIKSEVCVGQVSLQCEIDYMKCSLQAIMTPEQIKKADMLYSQMEHYKGK